jgi:hypothetical protein
MTAAPIQSFETLEGRTLYSTGGPDGLQTQPPPGEEISILLPAGMINSNGKPVYPGRTPHAPEPEPTFGFTAEEDVSFAKGSFERRKPYVS